MEDTLRGVLDERIAELQRSLNPCFNGRYSQRIVSFVYRKKDGTVLILVLMEDTLRGNRLFYSKP